MIFQLKYLPIVMNPVRIASEILKMLRSVIRLIFKTSSVTPDYFYVFKLILSFSTCSQSCKKICTWELLGANVLKLTHWMSINFWVRKQNFQIISLPDPYSNKVQTNLYKIPKFGVNRPNSKQDTAIWICQNLQCMAIRTLSEHSVRMA